MTTRKQAKKNCNNCKYLEWESAYFEDPWDSGWYCDKRDDDDLSEKMKRKGYREKAKVCCELRNLANQQEERDGE